jgi:mycofactocin system creatininase family protein
VTALETASWADLIAQAQRGVGPLFVVPLGSCEQHGPHLPFDVDTRVAGAVVASLAGAPGVVVGPALEYGASGEHEAFPGTVSIGTAALQLALLEIGRSASRWASSTLFVTGHGGNADALVGSVTTLRAEGRDAAWWPCSVPGGDAHAGRTETSVLLALRPAAVRLDLAQAGRTESVAALLPELRAAGVAAVSPNGVLGDPCGASAEEGVAVLAEVRERLGRDVAGWRVRTTDGRLLPSAVTG